MGWDLTKTATRIMGFEQWELLNILLENWNRPPPLGTLFKKDNLVPIFISAGGVNT